MKIGIIGAGSIGSPVYCSDHAREQIPGLLTAAVKDRISARRDLAMENSLLPSIGLATAKPTNLERLK